MHQGNNIFKVCQEKTKEFTIVFVFHDFVNILTYSVELFGEVIFCEVELVIDSSVFG